ncbi:predicted protein [Naegleria gruberi]|uniref:Predicted protein n=1 Tax=Naegleria gruberi TaxID=5762 RepID=D2VPK4_NAEGR|nr:uncharacterized protein NAEGRDRAFT_70892 [Naegleria gruberi]EFC41224.1 predicted protein [Naegleria gruberi]|eukprot:XP_002673968.1 predicted protein [Naegleria gruberi strain NEG-M]
MSQHVDDDRKQIFQIPAEQLSRQVLRGELTSLKLIEYFISRIEKTNKLLNAVCIPLFEEAREEALKLDKWLSEERPTDQDENLMSEWIEKILCEKPLFSIPVTIKESIHVKGTQCTMGLSSRVGILAQDDGILVKRLKNAGAIVLGKTNVALMLAADDSDNPVYGRTNNPFDLTRTSGGSSGGEGAIIGAGGSILGIGSDIGGSIRLPSSHCGIFGLKPTSGRLTLSGHAELYRGMEAIMSQMGPMGRSTSNLITAMKVLTRYEYDDYSSGFSHESIKHPPVELRDPYKIDISKLRIALFKDNGILTVPKSVKRGLDEAAQTLRKLGAHVEEIELPKEMKTFENWRSYVHFLMGDGMSCYRKEIAGSKLTPMAKSIKYVSLLPKWFVGVLGTVVSWLGQTILAKSMDSFLPITVSELWGHVANRDDFRRSFFELLDKGRYDAVLCPASSVNCKHENVPDVVLNMTYVHLFNYLGLPAGVCPITRVSESEQEENHISCPLSKNPNELPLKICNQNFKNSKGLPVCIQVAGRYWREDVVLAIMNALEQELKANEDFPLNYDFVKEQVTDK